MMQETFSQVMWWEEMYDMLTCFDDKFSCEMVNLPAQVIAPSVLRAVRTVNRLIYNRVAAVEIFREFALNIVPNISDEELDGVISTAIRGRGVDVQFESMKNALMKIAVVPNTILKDSKRHVVVFNKALVTVQSLATESILNDRQEFLHIVELIHSYSHALLPLLFALAESKQSSTLPLAVKPITTSDRFGVVAPGKGDMGSHWEEMTFGGQIIPQYHLCRRTPFHQPLQLKVCPNPDFPPHDEYNIRLHDIADEFIRSFLQRSRAWNEGERLPLGSIPTSQLHIVVDKLVPLRLAEFHRKRQTLSAVSRDDDDEGTTNPSRRKRQRRGFFCGSFKTASGSDDDSDDERHEGKKFFNSTGGPLAGGAASPRRQKELDALGRKY